MKPQDAQTRSIWRDGAGYEANIAGIRLRGFSPIPMGSGGPSFSSRPGCSRKRSTRFVFAEGPRTIRGPVDSPRCVLKMGAAKLTRPPPTDSVSRLREVGRCPTADRLR